MRLRKPIVKEVPGIYRKSIYNILDRWYAPNTAITASEALRAELRLDRLGLSAIEIGAIISDEIEKMYQAVAEEILRAAGSRGE